MNIKKSKFKRFSCVICAVLIGLLSVFAAIGFSPKKEKLSASADEVSVPSCQYYFYIPANFQFVCSSSAVNSNLYDISSSVYGFLRTGVYSPDDLGYVYRSITYACNVFLTKTLAELEETSFFSPFFGLYAYGVSTLTVAYDCFLPVVGVVVENYLNENDISFGDSNYVELPSAFWKYGGFIMFNNSAGSYSSKFSFSGPIFLYRSTSSSEEELQAKYDEGYEAGYAQGEEIGYDSGYTAGETDGYKNGVNISGATHSNMSYATTFAYACEILDDGSISDDYVDILNCERVNVGTLIGVPLYSLYLNDINKFTVGKTYRVVVQFSPFINYNTASSYLDELYISSGAYGKSVAFGDPAERLSNVTAEIYSTTATDYDTAQLTSFISPSTGYGESNLATFKTVSLADNTVKSCYIKGITFDITFDGYQGIAVFTTQNLLNDYLDFYNYTYAIAEQEGNANGYKSGQTDGYNTGYTTGYAQGTTEGLANAELGSFMNLATAVIDAPIKAFLGLLDFEILGMDMQKFFLSLLSAALIIAAYRLFSGGA